MNRDEIALEMAKVLLGNVDILKVNDDDTPVQELGFSVRACNLFMNNNIKTISDLERAYNDIWEYRNVGKRVVEEIETKLKKYRSIVKAKNEYEKIAEMSYLMADAMIKEGKRLEGCK